MRFMTTCSSLLGLALLVGCARWEIETVGTAPTVTEVALVAGSGEFAETVQRALEAESIRVVEREDAPFLLHARFEFEFHSRPYVTPAGPPNPATIARANPGSVIATRFPRRTIWRRDASDPRP